MRTLPLLTLLGIALSGTFSPAPASAIDYNDPNRKHVDSSVIARDKPLDKDVPPVADMPTATQRKELKGCESEKFYYGIGVPKDPVKARLCAYMERDGDGNGAYSYFGGSSILMMLYANGAGVPRNIDLAQHFSHEIGGAPAEIDGRQSGLESLREEIRGSDSASVETFDYCDNVTSSQSSGACVGLWERQEAGGREARLTRLRKGWSQEDLAAYARLRAAFEDFVQLRTGDEIKCSCQNYIVYAEGEESVLRNRFVAEIAQFEAAKWFPRYSPEDFRKADRELNSEFRKIQALKPLSRGSEWFGGRLRQEDVRNVQRAWLKYRDAWAEFGSVKYPRVSRESWKTWTTRKRTAMLTELLKQMELDRQAE